MKECNRESWRWCKQCWQLRTLWQGSTWAMEGTNTKSLQCWGIACATIWLGHSLEYSWSIPEGIRVSTLYNAQVFTLHHVILLSPVQIVRSSSHAFLCWFLQCSIIAHNTASPLLLIKNDICTVKRGSIMVPFWVFKSSLHTHAHTQHNRWITIAV